MSENDKDQVDQDPAKKDNIGCNSKMQTFSEKLKQEEQKILEVSSLDQYDDSLLYSHIREAESVLAISEHICSSLAPSIGDLSKSMTSTTNVIRERIRIIPDISEKFENSDFLTRIWKAANLMEGLTKRAENISEMATNTSQLASRAIEAMELSIKELNEALKELREAEKERKEIEKERQERLERREKLEQAKKASSCCNSITDMVSKTENCVEEAKREFREAERAIKENNIKTDRIQELNSLVSEFLTKAEKSLVKVQDIQKLTEKDASDAESMSKEESTTSGEIEALAINCRKNEENVRTLLNETQSDTEKSQKASQSILEAVNKEIANDEALQVVEKARRARSGIKETSMDITGMIAEASKLNSDNCHLDTLASLEKSKVTIEEENNSLTELADKLDNHADTIKEMKSNDSLADKLIDEIKSTKSSVEKSRNVVDNAKNKMKEFQIILDMAQKEKEKHDAAESLRARIEEAEKVAEKGGACDEEIARLVEETTNAAEESGTDTEESKTAVEATLKIAAETRRISENLQLLVEKLKQQTKKAGQTARQHQTSKLNQIIDADKNLKKTVEETKTVILGFQDIKDNARKAIEKVKDNNPKNWDIYRFPLIEEDEEDFHQYCIVRAPPGVLGGIKVTAKIEKDFPSGFNPINEREDLISNIVTIGPPNTELSSPAFVALPYPSRVRRLEGKEIVFKALNVKDGKWTILETTSTERIFDDYRGAIFAEAKVFSFATFIITSKLKKECRVIEEQGGTIISSIDPNIALVFPSGAVSKRTEVSVEVSPVEVSALSSLKNRKDTCKEMISASPIIHVHYEPAVEFLKPVSIKITTPYNPTKQTSRNRPKTALERKKAPAKKIRPKSGIELSFESLENDQKDGEVEDTSVHLLTRENLGSKWTKQYGTNFLPDRNETTLTFEQQEPFSHVMLIRTNNDPRTPPSIMAETYHKWLRTTLTNVIFHQHAEDRSRAIIDFVPSVDCEKVQQRLMAIGYEGPPEPSGDIELIEEQEIRAIFSGNIKIEPGCEDTIRFYGGRKNRLQVTLSVRDEYRNFANEFNKGKVEFMGKENNNSQIESSTDWKSLLVLPLTLPKDESQGISRIRPRTALKNSNFTGPFSDTGLRDLSSELGEEWEKLATYLGTKRPEIQRIKRNYPNEEERIFEMLASWRNRQPKGVNKEEALKEALVKCGRYDLGESLGHN